MSSLKTYRMYIAANWVAASGDKTFPVFNPATGEQIAAVADAGRVDVRAAIHAANEAFPGWAATPAHVRSHLMRRVGDLILKHADRLARTLTEEQGKPLLESKGEVISAAEYMYWYAEEARRVYGETIPANAPDSRIWVLRQPVGVVAAITPWNYPSSMITRKAAPALAAGCTVVIKPAEQTPLSALQIGELFHEAGLPKGVVNIVTTSDPSGFGSEILENLAVRKISFTGSTEVGKYLVQGASEQLKRVSMELGGNAPLIVFDDADIETAVNCAFTNKFRNAGQTCVCANRIYVQRPVLEEFTRRFVDRVSRLPVGDGRDPETQVGPLIDEVSYQKVEDHVTDAKDKGAQVLIGGYRVQGERFASGFYYAPTVLSGVTDTMKVVQEETFGPVAPIIPFDSVDEVVQRANATKYGLAAYIFTRNLGRTIRVSEQLEYGMVGVNEWLLAVPQAPFGGVKESGYGREGGHHGLDEYLAYKYLSVKLDS